MHQTSQLCCPENLEGKPKENMQRRNCGVY